MGQFTLAENQSPSLPKVAVISEPRGSMDYTWNRHPGRDYHREKKRAEAPGGGFR
jgi:hypothetical protein